MGRTQFIYYLHNLKNGKDLTGCANTARPNYFTLYTTCNTITLLKGGGNMKKKNTNANYEAWRKERGNWGAISPITKIVPNKKKNIAVKHKGKLEGENT